MLEIFGHSHIVSFSYWDIRTFGHSHIGSFAHLAIRMQPAHMTWEHAASSSVPLGVFSELGPSMDRWPLSCAAHGVLF